MTRKALSISVALATVLAAGAAVAQQSPGQARARAVTQSLNAGDGGSTLGSAPPTTPLPLPARPVAPSGDGDAVTRLLNRVGDVETAAVRRPQRPVADEGMARADVVAPEVAEATSTSALPPLMEGYYVRGDKACNQVWPGEGDIAYLSRIAFTIDFGGCDPSALEPIGDNRWTERQSCRTELGGEGPPNIIDYQVAEDGSLTTRTRLGENALGREDRWTLCSDVEEVPEEARFAGVSPTPGDGA